MGATLLSALLLAAPIVVATPGDAPIVDAPVRVKSAITEDARELPRGWWLSDEKMLKVGQAIASPPVTVEEATPFSTVVTGIVCGFAIGLVSGVALTAWVVSKI